MVVKQINEAGNTRTIDTLKNSEPHTCTVALTHAQCPRVIRTMLNIYASGRPPGHCFSYRRAGTDVYQQSLNECGRPCTDQSTWTMYQ